MLYIDQILTGTAAIITLSISFVNLIKKNKFTLNRLFSIIALLSAVLFFLFLLQLLNIKFQSGIQIGRLLAAIILFLSVLFFYLIQIYPDKKIKQMKWFIILTGLPGFIFVFITSGTNLVINNVVYKNYIKFHTGNFFFIYLLLVSIYLSGVIITIIIKSGLLKSKLLKRHMTYILSGIIVTIILLLISVLILPAYFNIYTFINIGIPISGVLIIIILNHAVYNLRIVNIKQFYIIIFSWLFIFTILFVPVFLALKYYADVFPGDMATSAMISGLILLYMFLIFKCKRPLIEFLTRGEYKTLEKTFTNFIESFTLTSISDNQNVFRDNFYSYSIDAFKVKFGITGVYFYIYNKKENNFYCIHKYGDKCDDIIPPDSVIIKCLEIHPSVLNESMLYSDITLQQFKDTALEFLSKNNFEIAMPIYDYNNQMYGLIFMGSMPGKKIYSKPFISFLELYRVQFQHQFLKGLILKNIEETQTIKHEQAVVNSIKKKIIPQKLKQTSGIRISSFYINNSMHGGDYFDSIKIGEDKTGIFIADSSYFGIKSAILSLELYSVLHSQSKNLDSPANTLDTMNWIVSTSRFSNKYAPAFCLVYSSHRELKFSNAAFNPLTIFDPKNNEFYSCDTKGIPIGINKEFRYKAKSLKPVPGSIGILYSNGFTAAINNNGGKYSFNRVKDIINKNQNEAPVTLIRKIYVDFNDYVGNKKQINDISIIIFKV